MDIDEQRTSDIGTPLKGQKRNVGPIPPHSPRTARSLSLLSTIIWAAMLLGSFDTSPQAAEPLAGTDQGDETPAAPETSVKVILQRDKSGNYIGTGAINDKDVRFLVDTGASMVIIPEPIAKRIGLKKGKSMPFRTGGGVITHYATELDTLSIGAIQISRAPAAINPQMQEDFVLLGMSALGLLHFSQEGDNLVLSYDPGANGASGRTATAPPPESVKFRRSVKECMGDSRVINQKTLECLKGN